MSENLDASKNHLSNAEIEIERYCGQGGLTAFRGKRKLWRT